jgi:flagellar biosynthesis/type III secretory pathway M-ring protein FliF/YscJ
VVYTHTESTLNYEVTQVQSKEVQAPGKVERVSLSVLVDGVTDQAQLDTLSSVIGAAAGIDDKRGDLLAVETLAFDRTFSEAQAAELESNKRMDLYIKIGEAVLAALIFAALLWYVQRLLSNLRLTSSDSWKPVLRPVSEMALAGAGGGQSGILTPGMAQQLAQLEQAAIGAGQLQSDGSQSLPIAQTVARRMPKVEMPSVSPELEQLQKVVDSMADDDPSSLAEAIQLWLGEDEKKSG